MRSHPHCPTLATCDLILMAKNRFLCPVRALRYYLERSMLWRENKRLLFVSNHDIDHILFHQQSPVGSAKPLWNVMHSHLLHSSSSIGLRHTRYSLCYKEITYNRTILVAKCEEVVSRITSMEISGVVGRCTDRSSSREISRGGGTVHG